MPNPEKPVSRSHFQFGLLLSLSYLIFYIFCYYIISNFIDHDLYLKHSWLSYYINFTTTILKHTSLLRYLSHTGYAIIILYGLTGMAGWFLIGIFLSIVSRKIPFVKSAKRPAVVLLAICGLFFLLLRESGLITREIIFLKTHDQSLAWFWSESTKEFGGSFYFKTQKQGEDLYLSISLPHSSEGNDKLFNTAQKRINMKKLSMAIYINTPVDSRPYQYQLIDLSLTRNGRPVKIRNVGKGYFIENGRLSGKAKEIWNNPKEGKWNVIPQINATFETDGVLKDGEKLLLNYHVVVQDPTGNSFIFQDQLTLESIHIEVP